MNPVCRIILFFSLPLLPVPAIAATVAVGTVAGDGTGISLQYQKQPGGAIHITGHFFQQDRAALETVYQHFIRPDWLPAGSRFYSGFGLRGHAARSTTGVREYYQMALPLGLQYAPPGWPVQAFFDQSVLIGDLPLTGFSTRFQGGFRTSF